MKKEISPKLYTLSAVVVGFLLLDDLSASEQNALGNWLMLASQVLCTNSYFRQLNNEKNTPSNEETLEMLTKMVKALEKEIDDIKKTNF